mgnify:CR=1 FL=1
MGSSKRWIGSTAAEAASCEKKMPWERGLRRQAMIARRVEETGGTSRITLPPMPSFMTQAVSA